MSIEKHIHVIVETKEGLFKVTTFRNQPCDWTLNQVVSWNGTDMYHTKVEGKVKAIKTNDWDYSKPHGQRATNIVDFGKFREYLTKARLQAI